MNINPVSPSLGATITDIALTNLDDGAFNQISQAFWDHSVIFFRGQYLTSEQFITFAERWSTINVNRFFKPLEGFPKIAEVRKEPDQRSNIGSSWHTDHSYDQIPAMASVLYAQEVPPIGGDTMFSCMYAAYDALSDGLKETLSGLNTVHSSRHVFGNRRGETDDDNRLGNQDAAQQDALHPIVIRHPDTGRKALYVNGNFTTHIEGWTAEESRSLLGYLYEHAARPEFTYSFQWEAGSIAMWDNRVTWHRALNDYHGHRRLMHRITLDGVALSA